MEKYILSLTALHEFISQQIIEFVGPTHFLLKFHQLPSSCLSLVHTFSISHVPVSLSLTRTMILMALGSLTDPNHKSHNVWVAFKIRPLWWV